MTKEEIDILWNKALRESVDDGSLYTRYRFAELVAAAEREACAKVCDLRARSYSMETDMWAHEHVSEAKICAAAIRARGETK